MVYPARTRSVPYAALWAKLVSHSNSLPIVVAHCEIFRVQIVLSESWPSLLPTSLPSPRSAYLSRTRCFTVATQSGNPNPLLGESSSNNWSRQFLPRLSRSAGRIAAHLIIWISNIIALFASLICIIYIDYVRRDSSRN